MHFIQKIGESSQEPGKACLVSQILANELRLTCMKPILIIARAQSQPV